MVQNSSPESTDFIFGNYDGVRAFPRALRAFENYKNCNFCSYFGLTRIIFERAARAEVRTRQKVLSHRAHRTF